MKKNIKDLGSTADIGELVIPVSLFANKGSTPPIKSVGEIPPIKAVAPPDQNGDAVVSKAAEVAKIKNRQDVKDIIHAEVQKQVLAFKKENEGQSFSYSNMSIVEGYQARVKNRDRVFKFHFSPYFSKVRGTYSKISFNLTPYTFSEGCNTWILQEHESLIHDRIDERHYPHGFNIKNNPDLLAMSEAYSNALKK